MIATLEHLQQLMRDAGAVRIYAKKLAPNDNSKNQVYLGDGFSALNIIPHGEVTPDDAEVAGAVRERAKAPVRFWWLDGDGQHAAPNVQLILYPKYPEVRMSGFLLGSRNAPSDVMRVRDEGRVLFFGITQDGLVLGHAAAAGSPLARALYAHDNLKQLGVFLEVPEEGSSRDRLLARLTAIYRKHWIASQKLGADGIARPYAARNGGGYTLEAELGISPNGYAEPDYLGWEVKQYGVGDFDRFKPRSPVTLMTPEPTGGYYREAGIQAFMRRYAYPDKSGKVGRVNFGGVYAANRDFHADTGLRLRMSGYEAGKITDMDGGIVLLDRNDNVAALWKYTGIIAHWNRKHAQAAYVPSLFRTPPPEYHYGPQILLCEQTDLTLFLDAVASGTVYYDPAIKAEGLDDENPAIKRRSQFRIRHDRLVDMYHHSEVVRLAI